MYVVRHVMGEQFNFTAMKKGLYKFCFYNRSWQQETVNLHVHIGPMLPKQQPIRTEHTIPVMELIHRLKKALDKVQFAQQLLHAQTAQQVLITHGMSKHVLHKAVIELVALIGCNILQVFLLQHLGTKMRNPPILLLSAKTVP
ncbi:unnamed protein product [Sphagnum compactum]